MSDDDRRRLRRALDEVSRLDLESARRRESEAIDRQQRGVIGEAMLTGCVPASDSKWFTGPFGFVLADAKPRAFLRCRGELSIWNL